MSRRAVLTAAQRAALLALPTDRAELARRYTLSEADLAIIGRRRRPRNRLGLALQLCALRYPGRLLRPGELIPHPTLAFVAEQIGAGPETLVDYAFRENTRYEHSSALQADFGFRPFTGSARAEVEAWLATRAIEARSGPELAGWLLDEIRRRRVIVPGPSTIERLCADALVRAEREVLARLTDGLDPDRARRLDAPLEVEPEDRLSRLARLRAPTGAASPGNFLDLVERLDRLRALGIDPERAGRVPYHHLPRLSREAERVSPDHLRDLPPLRRRGLLLATVLELIPRLTDDAMEMHERLVGRTFARAERRQLEAMREHRRLIDRTVRLYADLGMALIKARLAGEDAFAAIERLLDWASFEASVREAGELDERHGGDSLRSTVADYPQLRRYTPALLEAFTFRGVPAVRPLLDALSFLRELNASGRRRMPGDAPTGFVKPRWRGLVLRDGRIDRRYWELCLMAELRNALRAGDAWVVGGRRYRSLEDDLLPTATVARMRAEGRVTDPDADSFLAERRHRLEASLLEADREAARGCLPGVGIKDGRLVVAPLENQTPAAAGKLAQMLYDLLPRVRITDLLEEVDGWTGFTAAFTHLKTGVPPRERRLLLTTILADGVNLGLKRIAEACTAGSFWQLARVVDWHVREETYTRATACLVDSQRLAPLAALWGDGTASSSDGQHFHAGGHGEATGLVNARYGIEPGVKFYSHLSDQFGAFHAKVIAATANEALHVLDGLLQHESGLRVREHATDTGGFTGHVFALCALLGFRFVPRIRDLPEKRLYALAPAATWPALAPVIGGRLNPKLVADHWQEVVRLVASIRAGAVSPSHIMGKLAAYPRQNGLALALREIGRLERSLFLLEWLRSPELRHRVQTGLNKAEARNALARAVFFYRLGRLRDRAYENQQLRAKGLNLLVAAIVLWNTVYLGRAAEALRRHGHHVPEELLAHVWPLGWDHINLAGDYVWGERNPADPARPRPLRLDQIPGDSVFRFAA